jgi:hypothetical protein
MTDPGYRILTTGDLEIATMGTWRIIPGCSCRGLFEYQDRMAELGELVQAADPSESVEGLYAGDRRFRWLCDRVLELNGLSAELVRPRDLGWLLFGWLAEDGTPQQSPLAILNTPPEPRHPRQPSSDEGPSDFVRLLAAIMSLPDTSPEEAYKAATSLPAREVLGALDERAWAAMPAEDKDKIQFREQADRFREKLLKGQL